MFLEGASQRTSAIGSVSASLFDNPTFCFIRQAHFQTVPAHRLVDLIHLQLHHFEKIFVAQLIEDDDLIQAVYEFRIESLAHSGHHHVFHLGAGDIAGTLKAHGSFFLNKASANVRSHRDDRVLEIDSISKRISQDAVFKYLQEDVEDVRMRLFDFIRQ